MKRIARLCVWPLMAVVELILLVAGWVLAVVHPPTAARIVRIADRLPDPKWYLSAPVAPNGVRRKKGNNA